MLFRVFTTFAAWFTMKILVIFFACVVALSSSAILQIPKDNSHYIDGVSRYLWMPRDDGELDLVDLYEPLEHNQLRAAGDNNEYWLYTRENPNEYQLLINGDENSVVNSNFKSNRPTFILTHGWTSSGNSPSNTVQKNALFATLDCNVIVVDWRNDAGGSYTNAVNRVPGVGVAVGRFVDWLISSSSGNWKDVHLIGFSLGAHVVGNAGRAVGGRPARLTGLDPAGPLWRLNRNKLNADDAQYVEGIHTDSGVQGILSPVGDADFYPNGGGNQPGCSDTNCNHARSYQLFSSSIYTRHLVGRECTSLLQATANNNNCSGHELLLGTADLDKKGSGLYGLKTENSWPY